MFHMFYNLCFMILFFVFKMCSKKFIRKKKQAPKDFVWGDICWGVTTWSKEPVESLFLNVKIFIKHASIQRSRIETLYCSHIVGVMSPLGTPPVYELCILVSLIHYLYINVLFLTKSSVNSIFYKQLKINIYVILPVLFINNHNYLAYAEKN